MAEEWVLKVCHCFHRALPNSVGGMVDKHFNILLSPNLYRMLWVRLTCFHAEAAPHLLGKIKRSESAQQPVWTGYSGLCHC